VLSRLGLVDARIEAVEGVGGVVPAGDTQVEPVGLAEAEASFVFRSLALAGKLNGPSSLVWGDSVIVSITGDLSPSSQTFTVATLGNGALMITGKLAGTLGSSSFACG
jgi:hypothetical protein